MNGIRKRTETQDAIGVAVTGARRSRFSFYYPKHGGKIDE